MCYCNLLNSFKISSTQCTPDQVHATSDQNLLARTCLRPHEARRPVYTASDWQVRQPVYRDALARWRAYEEQLRPTMEILGDIVP